MKKLFLTGLLAVSAFGAQITLDISGGVNANLQSLDALYPEGTVTNAGITFDIGASPADNYWNALLDPSSNPRQLAVPVNMTGVTYFYALMNTMGGVAGLPTLASMTVFADDLSTFTVDLEGDDDIRSFSQGIFTNSINGTLPLNPGEWGTVNWFSDPSGIRLDALVLALPTAWATKNITLVVFDDNGDDLTQRMFVAGVTAETADTPTPEPATFGLVTGMVLVLVGLRKRG